MSDCGFGEQLRTLTEGQFVASGVLQANEFGEHAACLLSQRLAVESAWSYKKRSISKRFDAVVSPSEAPVQLPLLSITHLASAVRCLPCTSTARLHDKQQSSTMSGTMCVSSAHRARRSRVPVLWSASRGVSHQLCLRIKHRGLLRYLCMQL